MRPSFRLRLPLCSLAAALSAAPAASAAPPEAPGRGGASGLEAGAVEAPATYAEGSSAKASASTGFVGAPASAEAPEAAPGAPAPGFGLEVRVGARANWVTSAGFEPFQETDALAQGSFGASYAFARSGRLALLAGAFYDVGRARATTRGAEASLAVHRVSAGLEARYEWARLQPYARLAPGAVRLDARLDDAGGGPALESGNWAWSLDASAGAVFVLGPVGRRDAPLGRLLVFAEGGYGFASSVSMAMAPEAPDEGARVGAVPLPPLRPAGALLRAGAGFAFLAAAFHASGPSRPPPPSPADVAPRPVLECAAVTDLSAAARGLRDVVAGACRGLIERESLVELIVLSAVAGEHLLVVGPPGTAKSEAVRRVAGGLGLGYFEYLLGRFTEPSEIFGPVDLRKLREGVVETETAGMLPEAEVAFLDEVFLGSTAILNTLLGVLNERVFRRGHTTRRCPLRVCVGASNALPDDPSLAAFSDRFLVRCFVEPVPDTRLEELLEGGRRAPEPPTGGAPGLLDELAGAAREVDLGPVTSTYAHALRTLRQAGLWLSDRRVVKAQRLVAAAAALGGRRRASAADLWPLVFAVPTAEGQELARQALRELLAGAENEALRAAAEEASQGPLARAARIVRDADALLAEAPSSPEALAPWRLKLEGVAREIDAGFAPGDLPPLLAEARARLVAALKGAA